jgi:DNA replication protein DnaC
MTTPLFDRLRSHCQRLRLHRLEAELPTLLEQAAKREVPYSDFLDELLALEIRSKSEKHLMMRVSMARFPFHKSLDTFDFKFQPSIDPKVIRELATGRYLEAGDNVLLLGPPGVGKTPGRRPGPQGLRARRPGPVYDRGGAHRDAGQGTG